MKLLSIFRREEPKSEAPRVYSMAEAAEFFGFDDPGFKEFMRNGASGVVGVTVKDAMRNPTVFRCVSLISYAMGMLPLNLLNAGTKEKARDHPLYPLLHREPNNWQTAFNFRELMQRRALINGDAYALIVRSGNRVIRLVPLDPGMVEPRQRNDWSVEYRYTPKAGQTKILQPRDVLHVYADSEDGIRGTSLVKVAAQAIELARQLESAQSNFFKKGMLLGGMLSMPNALSPEAYERLKASLQEKYSGAENAGRWIIGEEGMEPHQFTSSAKDSQQLESRKLQIEEIGRVFGVPRPFLGVDDTSWGSGIDVLGQIFVRYTLNPWFSAWEQAIERSCFTDAEKEQFDVKFNAGALIRGSMKDQGEFFTKALGSGGHQPWMDYEEVRETMDLPEKEIAPNHLAQRKGNGNEPEKPS
ncbi:phage portal protein [Nitratireductor aquimarinus]|uniref:phage portal protein n=1 Tax=Alphaproteobacteria TaxID=28211 RepID=UPI0019D35751|nr:MULTISPECIES: phage portal protein [Alphaproteobacteria]MBN7755530.1 phage portal protein [Nitratireductor aquimarinus]MBY5998284.1 phage portal protein [Tritonibacter mobilis]MBY6020315.1 phage portal protein [Nitratireductor sp. DP7N14-4]